MAISFKYKDDNYLDSTGIVHNKELLSSIIEKNRKQIITVGVESAYSSPASNTIVSFNKVISIKGDLLTLTNSKIKIGSNINYIKVSASIGIANTSVNQVPILRLCKNDEVLNVFGLTTPTNSSNAWLTVTPFLIPVTEGDLIDLKIHGNSGNITVRNTSYMTIESI